MKRVSTHWVICIIIEASFVVVVVGVGVVFVFVVVAVVVVVVAVVVVVLPSVIIVRHLFKNIHPSLQYSSRSLIHASFFFFFFFFKNK